jgi:phosphatidylinositol alpha-1,6-mannosyltransferase
VIVAGWYPCGALGWVCLKLAGVPYTVISFGSELNFEYPMPISFSKRLLRKIFKTRIFGTASNHIAISNFTAGILRTIDCLDSEKIVTIRPGVDSDFFTPGESDQAVMGKFGLVAKRYILSVGRLVPNKGFDSVIRILPDLLENVPDLVYCIVGEGPDRNRLMGMIREYGLDDAVVLTGNLSSKELRNVYRNCEFFILPSRLDTEKGTIEGFGLTILETNACGRIAVGSTFGGIPEAIRDCETGFLFDENSQSGLKAILMKCLNDRTDRSTMEKQARQWAEMHDWQIVTGNLLKCIRNNTGQHPYK